MSSLSGAHFEADLPEPVADTRGEADLLRQAQLGDRGAYGKIVTLYQDRLFNAVLRLVGEREEALELTQEAFLRGLDKIDSFRSEASPYTWLFRIAMNLAISKLRKEQRHRTFSLDRPTPNGRQHDDDQAAGLVDRVAGRNESYPADELERRERNEQVLAALGRLDPEYRAVLVMRDVEGFDYRQMAQVLELPMGTLKSRLFRARLALRDELKSYLSNCFEVV